MTSERFRSLLVATVMSAAAVDAFPFAWQPTIQTPNPAFDVTSSYAVENLNFLSNGVVGADITDVMPIWIDEDGNEIHARSGLRDPNGWNPEEFAYLFSLSDFRSNGEYTLLFPEGLLVNAAGEKSDRLEWQFSFDVSELAPPMFDDFRVVSVSPDFSQPQAIWNNQRVSVSTNHNEAIGLTTLQLFDTTTGESLTLSSNFSTGRDVGNDSPIEWDVIGTFKFFEDHDYRADFVFYNGRDQYGPMGEPVAVVDRASYSFSGKVAPYAYSPVSLVEVTPVPGVSIISTPQQAVFTYVFSGPVTLYKAETPLGSAGTKVYPQSCISSNEDRTVWTLDLSNDSFLASQSSTVIINAYVRDADGVQLHGNEGSEGNSCFQYEWECELGASAIRIVKPDSGSSLERLSEVIVRSTGSAQLNWSWIGTAAIRNNDGEEIGRLSYDEGNGSGASQVTFTRWVPAGASSSQPLDIYKEGSYTVSFSHGCFSTGSESDSKLTRSASSSFYITGGGEVPPSYEDFMVISVSPDLQQAQGEWNNQTVSVNTNYNDAIGLVTLTVTDQTAGEYVLTSNNSATGRAPGNSSEISWSVPGSYKFLKGHSYKAEFIFYNGSGEPGGQPGVALEVGRVSYQFMGSVESAQDDAFSSISIENVVPYPGTSTLTSPDQAVFRYTFSGPVDVYKVVYEKADGSTLEFPASCLSSNTEKTVWTLDFSEDDYVRNLDGYLVMCLYARDLDGRPLKGNFGEKENSCFRYEWDCLLGALPVTVASPVSGSEVDMLTEVIVRSSGSLPITWAYGSASILNADGKVMGKLGYVNSSDVDAPEEIRFSWWIPSGESALQPLCLEEKGEYYLYFSPGSFLVGSHPDLRRSSAVSSAFSVAGRKFSSLSLESVEPSPGSLTVTSPDQAVFRYTFSGPVDVYKVASVKTDGSTLEYPVSCLSSNNDKTVWTLDLSDDDYVRNLDGYLVVCLYARDLDGLQLKGNYGEKENSCFRYEWDCMLGTLPVSVVSPESGSDVEILSEVIVRSSGSLPIAWAGGSASILNADGKVMGKLGYVESSDVDVPDEVRFSWWIPADESALQPLCLEEKGDYSVSFSAGSFFIGSHPDLHRSSAVSSSFAVSGPRYSYLSLVSVDPGPGSLTVTSPDQVVFRYTFSGPVSVWQALTFLPSGGTVEYPSSCLSSSDDMTVWTLDLSANPYVLDLDGMLEVSIYARDLDGRPLEGNFGEMENSCFRYEWDCLLGALSVEVVDPASGSLVEKLTEITVKSADGAPLSWAGGDAVLRDASGSILGSLHHSVETDMAAADMVRFTQWIPAGGMSSEPLLIDSDGSYRVEFGFGCFLIGEGPTARRSSPAEATFSVLRRVYSDATLLSVDPAPGSVVISDPEQAVFVFSFSDPVSIYRALTPLQNGVVVEYPLSCLSSVEDMSVWTLDLSQEQYVLTLDAPLVIEVYARDSDGYPVKGNFGEEENFCFRYEWNCTIGALPEATDTFVWDSVDPESGATVTSLSLIRIVYPDVAIPVESVVDVYARDDVPVLSARIDTDPDDDRVVLVSFPEPVTEDGVYSVVFREAMIADVAYVDSEGKTGSFSPAFTLVYTVGREDDAVDALTEYSHGDVFDLHGRLVLRMADASRLKMLPKGIYIYNGEKLVIK